MAYESWGLSNCQSCLRWAVGLRYPERCCILHPGRCLRSDRGSCSCAGISHQRDLNCYFRVKDVSFQSLSLPICEMVVVPLFQLALRYCNKHHDHNLTLPDNCLHLRKDRTGTKAETEAGTIKISWLPLACSATLLIQPRLTCLGMVPPTVVWVLLYQAAIKMLPQYMAIRTIRSGQFFSWGSLFR